MERDAVFDLLTISAQRKAAQMYLGVQQDILSSDAAREKNTAEEETRKAESDAADAAYNLEQRIRAIDGFEELLNEEELQRAKAAFAKRLELTKKIANLRQEHRGVDLEKAKRLMNENAELEKRIAHIRRVTATIEKYNISQ